MIACYHTIIDISWTSDELQQKTAAIPTNIKEKIFLKKNHLDVQLSVGGNLLLLELIKHFNLNLTLANIVYNNYHRPYFNTGLDFNISHAGNRVICCATPIGKVGVDIELIKPLNINYDDYFTSAEQLSINSAKEPDTEFFKYWTRKEALLKAIGTGVYTPLLDIDVSENKFTYKDKVYYLTPININPAYPGCIAHTAMQEICIKEIVL